MGGALTWKASKLKIVADSSAEAETAVASRAVKAVVAMRALLDELKRPAQGATAMLGDNQAARDTVVKRGCIARTRHFERAVMLVKHLYSRDVIEPNLVPTRHMVADIFTKALDGPAFYVFRDYILNLRTGNTAYVNLQGQSSRLWRKLVSG
jgi:hypothetical protein